MIFSQKEYISKNGYVEKGLTKKTRDTLLLRVCGIDYKKNEEKIKTILSTTKTKHVIIQYDENAWIDEIDLRRGGLLTVVDLTCGDEIRLSRGLVCCGASRVVFAGVDVGLLKERIEQVIKRQDERHVVMALTESNDGIVVETLFFDEDRFEKVTMELARAVAPFCPRVVTEYAYLPVFSHPKYSQAFSFVIKTDGYIEYPSFKKQSYLPLVASRDVFIVSVGIKKIPVTKENQ